MIGGLQKKIFFEEAKIRSWSWELMLERGLDTFFKQNDRKGSVSKMAEEESPICKELLDAHICVSVPCDTPHRLACFVQLENRTCPLCRRGFEDNIYETLRRIPYPVRRALAILVTNEK